MNFISVLSFIATTELILEVVEEIVEKYAETMKELEVVENLGLLLIKWIEFVGISYLTEREIEKVKEIFKIKTSSIFRLKEVLEASEIKKKKLDISFGSMLEKVKQCVSNFYKV
eukprot:TRINITY_DN243_c0_g1_i1.p1 TRINITY_DN243_c0_g1~~TRINITY_DN243_c0_g1_i1.p1  ORF type:complete len:114 (+),score=15.77 TRINITY_DN243_c0_g1_i1:77-418(+)